MGLKEIQSAGGFVGRRSISLASTAGLTYTSGSTTSLGRTFILLSADASVAPCRLRLYGDSASRDLTSELTRSFETKSILDSVSLIADISFSADARAFGLDPMLYGATFDQSKKIYYTIQTAGNVANTIQISQFLLEDNIEPSTATDYTLANRKSMYIITGAISSGSRVTGSIAQVTASSSTGFLSAPMPRSYLLLSASSAPNPTGNTCRVRLYSVGLSNISNTEISRSFSALPESSSGLIVDFLLDSSSVGFPFQPISFGANLNTVYTSQNITESPVPQTVYYILDNLSTSAVQHNVRIDLYGVED